MDSERQRQQGLVNIYDYLRVLWYVIRKHI